MKTKNFTLYLIILLLSLTLSAVGQRNGQARSENSRREIRYNRPEQKMKNQQATPQRRMETQRTVPQRRMETQKAVPQRKIENRNPQRTESTQNYQKNRGAERQTNRLNDRGNYDRKRDYQQENFRNRQFSNYYRRNHLPYHFRNNRNYFYNPQYGHIVRGFGHNPIILYSNRMPFYFDNSFLYRYYSGIGFVWIEDPYDMWFNELPHQAVRIIINGTIYFRLGNAYFEFDNRGYHLVILSDRYYSDDYYN